MATNCHPVAPTFNIQTLYFLSLYPQSHGVLPSNHCSLALITAVIIPMLWCCTRPQLLQCPFHAQEGISYPHQEQGAQTLATRALIKHSQVLSSENANKNEQL